MKSYKLYTPPLGAKPQPRINLYYKGVPLFAPAIFEDDRYSFQLPLNLSDKMITGDLIADLHYSEIGIRKARIPQSLILSDRYD